jgi:hypothetical protein
MKLLLLLAPLLTLDACQNPSRLQAAQSGPPVVSNAVVIADDFVARSSNRILNEPI